MFVIFAFELGYVTGYFYDLAIERWLHEIDSEAEAVVKSQDIISSKLFTLSWL